MLDCNLIWGEFSDWLSDWLVLVFGWFSGVFSGWLAVSFLGGVCLVLNCCFSNWCSGVCSVCVFAWLAVG